ncbi:MAG: PDZ domain-containing protein [Chthoniobacterales bacterium]
MKTNTIAVIASAALLPLVAFAQPQTAAPAPPAPPAAPGSPATPAIPPVPPNPHHNRPAMQPYTWLGLETSEVPRVVSEQLGFAKGFGLVVDYVVPNGPSAQAGVQQNDIIRMLNDQILMNPSQLSKLVRSFNEGDTVTLTILRKGQEQKMQVKLAKHESRDAFYGDHGSDFGMIGPDIEETKAQMAAMKEQMKDQLSEMKERIKEQTKDALANVDFGAIRDTVREAKRQAQRASQDARRQARELRINSKDGNAMHSTKIDLGKAQVVYSDDKGEMRLEMANGKKMLTAKDPQGRLLFSGPVDTKEEQDKMPADVRERYSKMETSELGGGNDGTTFSFTTKGDADDDDNDNDNDADDEDDNDSDDDDGGAASVEQVNYCPPCGERSIEASVL